MSSAHEKLDHDAPPHRYMEITGNVTVRFGVSAGADRQLEVPSEFDDRDTQAGSGSLSGDCQWCCIDSRYSPRRLQTTLSGPARGASLSATSCLGFQFQPVESTELAWVGLRPALS